MRRKRDADAAIAGQRRELLGSSRDDTVGFCIPEADQLVKHCGGLRRFGEQADGHECVAHVTDQRDAAGTHRLDALAQRIEDGGRSRHRVAPAGSTSSHAPSP